MGAGVFGVVRVTVSEQGNTCLAEAFETRRHVISSALDGFSDDERETLRDLLGRLVQTLLNPADPGDAHDSEDSRTHDTQEHSA